MALPSADGQDVNMAPGSAPANRALPGKTAALPQISVSAKVLRQRVDTYISKISGGCVQSDDHPMARWRIPICRFVPWSRDCRITIASSSSTGYRMTLAQRTYPRANRMPPEFFIVATMNPEATLKAPRFQFEWRANRIRSFHRHAARCTDLVYEMLAAMELQPAGLCFQGIFRDWLNFSPGVRLGSRFEVRHSRN
jgi:hypothetical protein